MMTKLMKQLQQWADEGAYQFPCEESPNGYIDVNGEGWAILYDLQSSFSSFGCLFNYVYRVLDGTIPVWRPVEHYQPPENAEVLALFLISENAGYELGIVETNVEKDFTHWQPLPQFIHERKETNNV